MSAGGTRISVTLMGTASTRSAPTCVNAQRASPSHLTKLTAKVTPITGSLPNLVKKVRRNIRRVCLETSAKVNAVDYVAIF